MAFDVSGKTPEVKPVPQEIAPNLEAEVEVGAPVHIEQPSVQYVEEPVRAQEEMPRVPDARNVMEVRASKDPLLQSIEQALADKSVLEIYNSLPQDKQTIFRETGEKLAKDIKGWIQNRKLKPHAVLKGVRAWLREVNGVSIWYLEQESKNKLDSILEVAESAEKVNNAM